MFRVLEELSFSEIRDVERVDIGDCFARLVGEAGRGLVCPNT